jgi:DNA polymerase delta subunit 1
MINVYDKCLEDAFVWGENISGVITKSLFPNARTTNLAFEKVYYPFLLVEKKNYWGIPYTRHPKTKVIGPGKPHFKGLGWSRKYAPPIYSEAAAVVFSTVGNTKLSQDERFEKISSGLKDIYTQTYAGEQSFYKFIWTINLSKPLKDYVVPQAHSFVAQKKQNREGGVEAEAGDRIPYVLVNQPYATKVYQRAEDPLFALVQNLELDYPYYMNRLKDDILSTVAFVISGPQLKQLNGMLSSLRSSVVRTGPPPKASGLLRHFSCEKLCPMCRKLRIGEKDIVCSSCLPEARTFFGTKWEAEKTRKSAIYETCYTCQGHRGTIECTAQDCQNFYKRRESDRNEQSLAKKVHDIEELFQLL